MCVETKFFGSLALTGCVFRQAMTEQLEAEEQKCGVYEKQLKEQEILLRNLTDKLAGLREEQQLASANIDKAANDQQQIDTLRARIVELEEQTKSMDAVQDKITQSERCLDELRVEKAALEGELAGARRALSDIRAELEEKSASARRLQEEQQTLIAGHRREVESRSAAQKAHLA
jgi:chromosome segregation ATPase